jgi:hypothetical protein
MQGLLRTCAPDDVICGNPAWLTILSRDMIAYAPGEMADHG